MKKPLRHPKDPKGYDVVRTDLSKGSACSQCAVGRARLPDCVGAPCYFFRRPDGEDIHYVKRKTRKGRA